MNEPKRYEICNPCYHETHDGNWMSIDDPAYQEMQRKASEYDTVKTKAEAFDVLRELFFANGKVSIEDVGDYIEVDYWTIDDVVNVRIGDAMCDFEAAIRAAHAAMQAMTVEEISDHDLRAAYSRPCANPDDCPACQAMKEDNDA